MSAAAESLSALFLADDPSAVLRAAAAVASRSCGRVRKPEGINRRTGKPERDGLYCARLFGPVADNCCICGKLDGPAHAGETCDRCGVLCGERRLRGERWGHVEVPVALVHPVLAPRIAAALGCGVKGLMAVLRHEGDLREDGSVGPPDMEAEEPARGPWHVAERLGERAAELLLTRVPVTPPDWRGTRSDPQDAAYMRLLHRCNRLDRLIELNAPRIILYNEALHAQVAFDQVYAAVRAELGARGPAVVAPVTPRSAALLRAVLDDPDDDRPRRAYAAHLAAAGDPRGEFIQLQLATAARSRAPRVDLLTQLAAGVRPRTTQRESDLLRRNFERWLDPLTSVAADPIFRRGFLAACKVPTACADPRIGDPAWATVEHLDTADVALICDAELRALQSLALPFDALRRLCDGPWVLPRILALQVRLSRCPPAQPGPFTAAEALPGVRALTLIHRPARGAQDWSWLDDTPLVRQIERLRVSVALERVESPALPWCVGLMERHAQLERVDLVLGARQLALELRRDGEWITLRAALSRGLMERIIMGASELAEGLARGLTALEPGRVAVLRVESSCGWYGDDLAALAASLRSHFGATLRLPRSD